MMPSRPHKLLTSVSVEVRIPPERHEKERSRRSPRRAKSLSGSIGGVGLERMEASHNETNYGEALGSGLQHGHVGLPQCSWSA